MAWWVALAWFIGTSIVSALLAKHPANAVASSMGDFTAPTAEEGRPIPLFFGTCKVQGPNVTWWGALRAVAIKKTSGGFLGIGAKKVTVGYRYYLGMQMALASGQGESTTGIDLVDVIVGDKSLGVSNNFNAAGVVKYIDNQGLFGGEEKEGGLQGNMAFYFGSSTQTGDPYLAQQFGSVPGYRGVCYAVLRDFYIGTSTYLKQWAFILRNCPYPAGMPSSKANINGDANPAYMIVSMLTLDRELGGLGVSPTRIDLASFQAVADTLYTEGFGMSMFCDKTQSADSWIAEVCRTVDGVVYTDPSTGLWTMKLIRADYDPATLLEFDESSILEVPEVSRPSWPETLNKITVRYTDRSQNYTVRTAQDKDSANRAIVGVNRESTIDYLSVSNGNLAQVLASREIRGHAYPFASMTLVLNRKAWALRPGSAFKVTWGALGLNSLVCRVSNIRYGDFNDGRITIDAVQDVFTNPASLYVAPPSSDWTSPAVQPSPVAAQLVIEAPYWMIGESRNILVMATPSDSSHRAEVWTNQGAGYLHTSDMEALTPSGLLVGAAYDKRTEALDTLVGFTLGSCVELDRLVSTNTDGLDRGDNIGVFADTGEIFGWTTITDNLDGTYSFVGITRGLMDTVPETHPVGTRVFFLSEGFATTLPTTDGGGGGTPGAPGVNGRSYVWKGVWSNITAYVVDDVVYRNGSSYVSIQDGSNRDPETATLYWSLMAKKGTDGTNGVDGVSTFTRTTVSTTTASLSPNTVANASVVIKRTANLLKITTNYPAWVRVYGTAAARTADSSRLITEDYAPGSGCYADVSTPDPATGSYVINLSPVPVFVNSDATPADTAYLSIKNLDSVARAITTDILYLPLEA